MNTWSNLLKVVTILIVSTLSADLIAESKQLFVVTNLQNIEKLSKSQIRQIYLEGAIKIPVKPLGFKSGDKYRSVFHVKIIGLTESRIESYWAQMKFTGRALPPKEFSGVEDLLAFLEENPGFIAYLPAHIEIPSWLNVVYTIDY